MTRMTEMIPLICLSSAFLCATSVFSVSRWWNLVGNHSPQRHREHRGRTEIFKLDLSTCNGALSCQPLGLFERTNSLEKAAALP